MTGVVEVKSLTEVEATQGLVLDEGSREFLENPYREAFMTEFLLGSNKLKFYGIVLIMSKYSELIKTSLANLAASKPPYELLTFGTVLERPMTLIWLYINDYEMFGLNPHLTLGEFLHMYRLAAYFGIGTETLSRIMSPTIAAFTRTSLEERNKTLEDAKNKDTLIRMLNQFFKVNTGENWYQDWESLLNEDVKKLSAERETPLNLTELRRFAITNLFLRIDEHPDIAKSIDYIPVYVNKIYIPTFAERKALINPNSLGKLNPEWKAEPYVFDKTAFKKTVGPAAMTLVPDFWGPDNIVFTLTVTPADSPDVPRIMLRNPLNPILAS